MKFTIILPPKAQKRAKARAFQKGNRTMALTYKDTQQRQEENKLLALLYEHRPPAPLQGPILLGIKAYLPIPKGFSKQKRQDILEGKLQPTTKPDLDNLIKHFKDCCKGIFWFDDRQVVGYLPGTGKYYGEPPRWEIEIFEGTGITQT